ncbi:MAG: VOC family protein [Acidimicrobiales bacterium]
MDLATPDGDAARAFYPALFGWTAEEASAEFGGYFMFTQKGVPVAGCMPQAGTPVPAWSVYLAVADAGKTIESATAEGASVVVPAMPVGDLGVMALIADPAGSVIGLWEPRAFPGLQLLTEAGAPSYFELHTLDYDRVLDFYRSAFGWETTVMSDVPTFRYTQPVAGGAPFAGVLDASSLPSGAPTGWSVYVGSDDTEATVARAAELGAQVLRPAEDTPYGRLAELADPAGARFKVVSANEQMPAR